MKKVSNILLPIKRLLGIWLCVCVSYHVFAQSGTQGSTFIGPGLEMAVYQDHSFRAGSGLVPGGLIGTERTFPYGIFSFVEGSQWNGATDSAFVDGYVRKYGTGLFTFPIGDNGKYRPLRVSGTFGTDSTHTAAYFGVSPGVAVTSNLAGGNYGPLPFGTTYDPAIKQTDVGGVSEREYWHLMGDAPTVVSLSYDANSQAGLLAQNDITRLRIVGWHTANQRWEIISSLRDAISFQGYASTLDSGSITTISAIRPSDYSIITLGGTAIVTCIDTDNDGISDCDDLCPLVPGVAPTGCPLGVQVAAKVWLQGALYGETNPLMRDDLRVKNLIPLQNPYPSLGFTLTEASGPIQASVLQMTGADAIVDWIILELRDKSDSTQIIASKAGLVQRDGDIVDLDGTSVMTFSGISQDDYFLAVRHRNHLGVMTASTSDFRVGTVTIDFRVQSTSIYRNNLLAQSLPMVSTTQGMALWAGNVLHDPSEQNGIIFQGTENDVNPIYQMIFSSPGNQMFQIPSFKLRTYNPGDVDMNGETIFQGSQNDVEYIYMNVIMNHGGNFLRVPNFIIREQLPY